MNIDSILFRLFSFYSNLFHLFRIPKSENWSHTIAQHLAFQFGEALGQCHRLESREDGAQSQVYLPARIHRVVVVRIRSTQRVDGTHDRAKHENQ